MCPSSGIAHRLALEVAMLRMPSDRKQFETADVNTGNNRYPFAGIDRDERHRENCRVKSMSPRASAFDWPAPASAATYRISVKPSKRRRSATTY